jgi:hypothetical protein
MRSWVGKNSLDRPYKISQIGIHQNKNVLFSKRYCLNKLKKTATD